MDVGKPGHDTTALQQCRHCTSLSSGIVTAGQYGPGKCGVRFFSPQIAFAVKVSDGSIDAGRARASKSNCVCVYSGLGVGG